MNGSFSFTPPFFSMGLDTFKVPVDGVFVENRRKLVSKLKEQQVKGVVYLTGGPSTTRFDSDHEPLFRQESYFHYLTGVKEPDCSLTIQVETGHTCLYVPELPASYATIMGRIRTTDEWKDLYQVEQVKYTKDVEASLLDMMESSSKLLLLKGLNSDSG